MRRAEHFLIFFLVWAVATGASGEIILVGPGEEYTTVQSGIDAASVGDVVQVLPGKYVENVVLKEGVDVVGSGAEQTIITSRSESFPMATVDGKDNSTLGGFTVTGGYYGIMCNGVSPTITDCVVWRNSCCGIMIDGSSATISRCVIAQNPRYGVQCLGSSAPAISNCTLSANGYGVSSSLSAPALTNCILWGNWDDLEGIDGAGSVSHCDIEDGDFAGDSGNISAAPSFVGWGSFDDSDNQLYVDVAHTGAENGTRENPFTKITTALSAYSYHLGFGSPCLNAGEGNVHMGAYPEEQPPQAPGSDSVVVNVAAGTYYESRLYACHSAQVRGGEDSPARIVAFGDTGFFVLGPGRPSVENFVISGANDAIACFFSEARVGNCVILECGQNAIYSYQASVSVRCCHTFYNFNAGILLAGSSGEISDCLFGEDGWAGIACMGGSSATVRNCVLTESPVGLSCSAGSDVVLQNTTVSNNGWKGIEAMEGASVTILNSIVWGNPFGDLSEEGGSIEASFSDIGGGLPGEGNIVANPLFEEGPLGGFYLDSDSQCVDRGSDTAENIGLEGKTTLRTSEPDSATVDMGYHYEKFEIRGITLNDGEVVLRWPSTPQLDYAVFGAPAVGVPGAWQPLGEATATWTQERYTLAEPSASAEFYRVSRR